MVNAVGGTDSLAGFADRGDNANDACAGQRLDLAFRLWSGIAFVCGYIAGYIPGMCGTEYAAVGDAFNIGTAADADAFRRFNAHGKYANVGAKVMQAAPTTHFVEFCQAILFRGAGIEVVWKPFLKLFIIGTLLFVFSLARFRKSVAQ